MSNERNELSEQLRERRAKRQKLVDTAGDLLAPLTQTLAKMKAEGYLAHLDLKPDDTRENTLTGLLTCASIDDFVSASYAEYEVTVNVGKDPRILLARILDETISEYEYDWRESALDETDVRVALGPNGGGAEHLAGRIWHETLRWQFPDKKSADTLEKRLGDPAETERDTPLSPGETPQRDMFDSSLKAAETAVEVARRNMVERAWTKLKPLRKALEDMRTAGVDADMTLGWGVEEMGLTVARGEAKAPWAASNSVEKHFLTVDFRNGHPTFELRAPDGNVMRNEELTDRTVRGLAHEMTRAAADMLDREETPGIKV